MFWNRLQGKVIQYVALQIFHVDVSHTMQIYTAYFHKRTKVENKIVLLDNCNI